MLVREAKRVTLIWCSMNLLMLMVLIRNGWMKLS